MLRRVKLMNPFEIVQESPRPARAGTAAAAARRTQGDQSRRTLTPVCAACGSDDIICQATAQWSNEAQEWQLANTFNQPAHCNTCNHDGNLVWLTLN